MCNLFRACLYFEEDILIKIVKKAGYKNKKIKIMSEVTDIPLLIWKYCIIKK